MNTQCKHRPSAGFAAKFVSTGVALNVCLLWLLSARAEAMIVDPIIPAFAWYGWENLGESTLHGPECISTQTNRIDCFTIGYGNAISRRSWDGSVWRDWAPVSTWTQQAYVKASNTGTGDRFGYSIALSADGNTLAVGANGEASSATGVNGNQSDNSAAESGALYVFTRTGTTWAQQAYVKASKTSAYFGSDVALSANGNTLAARGGDDSNATGINGNQSDNSAPNSGAVYLF